MTQGFDNWKYFKLRMLERLFCHPDPELVEGEGSGFTIKMLVRLVIPAQAGIQTLRNTFVMNSKTNGIL